VKFLMTSIGLALGLYIAILIIIYFGQRRIIYFPPNIYLSPSAVNVEMKEIKNEAGEIVSWWAPPREETSKTVMVFHGNGSAIYSNHDIFRDLIEAGHGVLSVGYPGYPGRLGKPVQTEIIAAAQAQYDWLLKQGIPENNIVFYGTSIGSGVAAQLSLTREPVLLFMDAPFNSMSDMAKRAMKIVPVDLLMKDTFDSGQALKGKNIPLIWTHGTKDNVVPLGQGQKLYDNYEGLKDAHIIQGGEHTNLWALGGREITLEQLKQLN